VWDRDADGAPNIVGVYVSYLRKKLGDAGAPQLLETANGGYMLKTELTGGSRNRKTREP
jgi:DNA-binding response OmpR family regulator